MGDETRDGVDRRALAEALAAALAPAFDGLDGEARALGAALAAEVGDASDPEASLRIADGAVRGGRMMLERAGAGCARRIAEGLRLPWGSRAAAVTEACEALGLPLITGWDVGGARRLYKLYANASEASEARRAELAARLGVAAPGHVIGLNVAADRVVTKVYRQAWRRDALGVWVPDAFGAIEAVAWVASFDVDRESETLRAVFAAPVPETGSAHAALEALTGVAWGALEGRFPFPPGPLRQIGWSPSGAVTVYAKPRGTATPVQALEPVAVFRAGAAEVGLVVEPTEGAPRAFARTERHALTLRTREGEPPPRQLEALGRWAAAQVARAERHGGAFALDAPPAPWVRVRGTPAAQ